jgi:hypothetical protein
MRLPLGLVLALSLVACADKKEAGGPDNTTKPVADKETAGGPDNINKLVIGGDNTRPQMGLFALKSADAEQVDAAMQSGLKGAYELAQKLAVKKSDGDRSFCEDAVRQIIGFMGIDGMMSEEQLAEWKTLELAAVEQQHLAAIRERHQMMIKEDDKGACKKDLAKYQEVLRFAATEKLELRNFGY